jgi:signal peptidase I
MRRLTERIHRPLRGRLLRMLHEWRGFLLFVAVMLVFRSAVADWNDVPSASMQPTILVGDRVVVDKLAYDLRVPFTLLRLAHWQDPQRGDIVTFPSPQDERLFIKRVIGLPGDLVEMRDNRLIVNGAPAAYEPLPAPQEAFRHLGDGDAAYQLLVERLDSGAHVIMLDPRRRDAYQSFAPVRVPPGQYLVLGDNRDASGDSRVIGFIARERMTGRARAIAFSLDRDNYWLPRPDRFFTGVD